MERGAEVNAFLLMIPLFLIRFGLLGLTNREALRRAAYFAPTEGNEKKVLVIYQISNMFIISYPFVLKIQTEAPLFIVALFVYVAGNCVLVASTVSFAKPKQSGINLSGIYKISRNPMYMGYLIYFLGCVMLTHSLLLLASLIVFQVSAHWIILSEKRWCINKFGSEYTHYMKRVRRYI